MASRKVKEVRKAQYYVYYMGWKECLGMHGRQYTDDVVRELVQIHSRHPYAMLNKLTVQLSSKEVKITQEIDKGRGKIAKAKLPGIPAKDVCYAVQGPSPDEDVVAAIFLGYNPQTECAVHVHVYRCDSPETAMIMVEHFSQIASIPEHSLRLARIEYDLMTKGHIEPKDSAEPVEPKPQTRKQPLFKSLAEELKAKLSMTDEAPILLPPIDYDTMSRAQGKLALRHHRKSLQHDSIAPGGVFIRKFAERDNTSLHGSISSSGSEPRSSEGYSSPPVNRNHMDRTAGLDSQTHYNRNHMERTSSVQDTPVQYNRNHRDRTPSMDSPVQTRRPNSNYQPPLRHTFQEGDFRKLHRTDAEPYGHR